MQNAEHLCCSAHVTDKTKIKALSRKKSFSLSPTVHFAQHQRLDGVELSIRCQVEFFNVILVDLEEEKYDLIYFGKWDNLGGEF